MYFVLTLEIPYREKPILASMYRLEENEWPVILAKNILMKMPTVL